MSTPIREKLMTNIFSLGNETFNMRVMLLVPSLADYSKSDREDMKPFLLFKVFDVAKQHVFNLLFSVKYVQSSFPMVALSNSLSLFFLRFS